MRTISFVWPTALPFAPWAGGSETYTLRHIRALRERGVNARLLVSEEVAQNMPALADVPVVGMPKKQLAQLDDTLVFVMKPDAEVAASALRHQSYIILHLPVKGLNHDDSQFYTQNGTLGHTPLVTSNYMAKHWRQALGLQHDPAVVYPPVEAVFSEVPRAANVTVTPRVLFAGRPTPSKGVYELLEALHLAPLNKAEYAVTCVKTINNDGGSDTVNALFDAHPRIRTVEAQNTPERMAALYAEHDVVVMPSKWSEPFGMISVEAQHAGCRVVASDIGGLPETDCGGLMLAEAGNPAALAEAIVAAASAGPLTQQQRAEAARRFTVAESVDSLLRALA
jgi:D-inositol-3-phosphate glycosyltransferase